MKENRTLDIIDSHQHVFWHGRDDFALIADMDSQGISKAWILTWEIPSGVINEDSVNFTRVLNPCAVRSDGSHPGIKLNDLVSVSRRFPGRFILGYCPDPSLPNAPDLFETACDMYGVRVCGEWKFRMLIDDPRCLELFRAAGRRGAPVVLHLDVPYLRSDCDEMIYQTDWYGGTVENLERVLRACPETNFIGHAPGFWREISAGAQNDYEKYPRSPVVPGGRIEELLKDYSNLFVDLSAGSALVALCRDKSYSRDLLCQFPDRFLFARDYYGSELMDMLDQLELPQSVEEQIFSRNAESLVGKGEIRFGRSISKLNRA